MVNTRPYIWDLREWNGVVVNTRLVLNSFFWSSPTLIVFRLLGMVSAYVFFCVCLDSCVCSWWAEIKMRVDFFFFFSLWSNGNLTRWYVYTTRFLQTMFFGYFSCWWSKSKWKLGPSLGSICICGLWVVLALNFLAYHVQVGVDMDHKFTIMVCVCEIWPK